MKKTMTASDYIQLAQNEVDEQYSNFTQNDPPVNDFMYATATPVSPMASCVQQVRQAVPYIFVITNTNTSTSQKAVLFGVNEFALSGPHYGSDAGITITLENSKFSYANVLMQNLQNPFVTSKWRMSCSDPVQLQATISIIYSNMADGRFAGEPLSCSQESNLYANNPNIIEFYRDVKVDGNTKFEIYIRPSATLYLAIYPSGVVDATQALSNIGGAIAKKYTIAPMNAMPTTPQIVGQQF